MTTTVPAAESRVYFPGLNGIRALAALSVLFYHLNEYKWRLNLEYPPMFPKVLLNGINAVIMFFVLSGFLITYLLLIEIQKSGTVSVRKFYARRILRIWPVYYLLIFLGLTLFPLIMQTTGYQGNFAPVPLQPIHILLYVAFIPNAVGFLGGSWPVFSQLWTIGIEEQFYLVWPALSKLFARRMLPLIIGMIVVKILLNNYFLSIVVDANYSQGYRNFIAFLNNLRFENMAVGALGAYILFHRHWLLKIIFHPVVEKLTLAFMIYNVLFLDPADNPPDNLLFCIPYILFILNISSNPHSTLKLENRFWNWLGTLSYGIYMYHLFVIYLVFIAFNYINVSQWNNIVFNITVYVLITGLTIAAAEVSHRWFEAPFLRLKRRFTIVKSGAPNGDAPEPVATVPVSQP
ncbi:MAG: acyltransferase [Chloroflexi bacterium]|nr:acyltransferase [Chloroflexota bacterium]MCC6894286.1 acyltransferase [Anaerolineae bacterium]